MHSYLHVSHVFVGIDVDGAVLTPAAQVVPCRSQTEFELNCWGGATFRGMRKLSPTNGSLCISTRAATGWATNISPPCIAEDASFTMLGPPTTLTLVTRLCDPASVQPFLHV